MQILTCHTKWETGNQWGQEGGARRKEDLTAEGEEEEARR